MNYSINLENDLSQLEDKILHDKILQYNFEKSGFTAKLFMILIRDDMNNIVGGLKAYCYGNSCFVDILFLDENVRGKGFGTQLMEMAEQEAKQNDCNFMHLDTFSFQALPFYQKLGYTVFAELEYNSDVKRFYLKKNI